MASIASQSTCRDLTINSCGLSHDDNARDEALANLPNLHWHYCLIVTTIVYGIIMKTISLSLMVLLLVLSL